MKRHGLLLLVLGLLTGCGYGPPEEISRIEHASHRWNSHTVAVAVSRVRQRPPQGLATFPNGGVPRVLDASVSLYFGDPVRSWLRLATEFPVPAHLLHGLDAHVAGWESDAAYLTVSGCAQSECWGDLRNRETYLVRTNGTLATADSVPEAARPRGESLARMRGEYRYLRIGFGADHVEASLEPGGEREVVFRVDPVTGVLQRVESKRFPGPSASGVDAPRPEGERIYDALSVTLPVVGDGCLDHPWRDGPAWPAEQKLSHRCETVETGSLPGTGPLDWMWALYRHESVYAAPPDVLESDLDLYPDTVREEELILLVSRRGEQSAQPVWHDRAESAVWFLRPPRAARLADESVFFVHRRCVNGTGGCSDYPFRLTNAGRVDRLEPAYAGHVIRVLPDGWGTAKGIQIEPDAMMARAAVYLPVDANCCPSFGATASLRVVLDSLVADSVVLEPASGGVWLIQPGERFGPIGGESTEPQLQEWFGSTSATRSEIHVGEDFCTAGLRVFAGRSSEIEVAWSDSARTRPAFVRTAGVSRAWVTPAGVRVGTSLKDLERIGGGPIEFAGFGWDYGGSALWEEESGAIRLQLAIPPESGPELERLARIGAPVREIQGDRTVRSDHEVVRQIGVEVTGLALWFDRPYETRECER